MYETNMTIDRHTALTGSVNQSSNTFSKLQMSIVWLIHGRYFEMLCDILNKAHDYMFPYHETQITTSIENAAPEERGAGEEPYTHWLKV
jgi:hypothetical protein